MNHYFQYYQYNRENLYMKAFKAVCQMWHHKHMTPLANGDGDLHIISSNNRIINRGKEKSLITNRFSLERGFLQFILYRL